MLMINKRWLRSYQQFEKNIMKWLDKKQKENKN